MSKTIGTVECTIDAVESADDNTSFVVHLRVPARYSPSLSYIVRETSARQTQPDCPPLHAEFGWYRPKRSLNANAYFHVLVDMIAKAVGASESETKKRLVVEYGAVAKQKGSVVVVTLPEGTDVDEFYPYARWIGTVQVPPSAASPATPSNYDQYIFFKQTHTLDTAEMATLIDGTVREARELGLPVRAQTDIDRLLADWKPADK